MGLCVLSSSPYLDPGQTGLGLILMTSLDLNSLFQSPISKHSHILRCWGLRFQQMNVGRDKVQLITSKETAAHLLELPTGGNHWLFYPTMNKKHPNVLGTSLLSRKEESITRPWGKLMTRGQMPKATDDRHSEGGTCRPHAEHEKLPP